MKTITIYLFFLPILLINSQTIKLKGRVITEDARPVYGANIIVSGTTNGAAADENGYFEIGNINLGTNTLQVSAIGYEKKNITISVSQISKPITIVLRSTIIETDQIIISAGKYEQKREDLTVSTTVINPEYIDKQNFLTFDDMLRTITGVQMNLEQVSIRGSSGYSKGVGARVLVALNGIPLYAGDNGDVVWELIPLTDIERVEIIKGPASSLYGSSAIGGVINIITKNYVKSPVTSLATYYGIYDSPSYDIWKWNESPREFYGMAITHSNSYKNLGYTLSLKKFDNMSYRQNDFNKKYLGYLKLDYEFENGNNLTFFADYLNMNRGNYLYWKDSRNALVPKDEDNGNTVRSSRFFSGLIYRHSFNKYFNAEFKSSFYRTRFDGYGLSITSSLANLFARGFS
jgi:iron complex outermembrane receptor protein